MSDPDDMTIRYTEDIVYKGPRGVQERQMPAPIEKIERVEFIIKQHTVICNVLTNQFMERGVWKHKEFPASMSIIDFLMNGNMESAMQWPEGRKE